MKKLSTLVLALSLAACAAPQKTAVRRPGLTESVRLGDAMEVSTVIPNAYTERISAPHTTYAWRHLAADGSVKGEWTSDNTVLTGGRNDLLDKYFKGSAYTAGWYLALKGTGTIAAGDTWASHAGWSEVTPYTGNRPTVTWGTTSAGSNTATQISISINATATVAGACLSAVATGTAGPLYSCTDFAASRSVVSGDTLQVTPTVTD